VTLPILAGVLLVAACSDREVPRLEHRAADAPAAPAESLVVRMADSAEVWFTGSMLDTAAGGETCYERTVEIRRGGSTTPVPLLYTISVPVVMDDTTFRADLMRDCARVDTYLVNTRTAQPRRVP
jgi:hypothetical protein